MQTLSYTLGDTVDVPSYVSTAGATVDQTGWEWWLGITVDGGYLRDMLNRVIAATPDVDVTVGAFVGDKAGERRVADNLAAGRIYFRTARRRAFWP